MHYIVTMTKQRPLPTWPRGLRREDAASYLGISATTFDQMVAERRMPEPRQASRGRVVWDRHELDGAFDRLPKRGEATGNPWDRIF